MYIYYLVDDINYHINWWADTDSKKTCSKASKEVSYNIVGEMAKEMAKEIWLKWESTIVYGSPPIIMPTYLMAKICSLYLQVTVIKIL
jgi:hypothetical protein